MFDERKATIRRKVLLSAKQADLFVLVPSHVSAHQRMQLADRMNSTIEDIKLQYLYPRIDAEVSKHQNHLLKSPFVVHPGTGRVCVPVNPDLVDDFDPEEVPTVGMLLRELDKVKIEEGGRETNWEHTSLKPYVDMFDKHINAVIKDNTRGKEG